VADVREAILARLVELVATVPNIRTVQRNNVDWTEDQLPLGIVLDGDEDVVSGNERSSRLPGGPLIVEMMPDIQIGEQSDSIGSDLDTFRGALMKLVLFDATLDALTGSNGKISYLGCVTVFNWFEKQYGTLQMRFSFKYPLKPNDL
jgi:hypothetical protein